MLGTNGGAYAQLGEGDADAGPSLSPRTQPAHRAINPSHTSHGARRQGQAMVENRSANIQEIRKYAEVPMTAENEGRVNKLDSQAEQLFSQGRYNDALLRWQEAYGLSIEMKYSRGQGRALCGMSRVYLSQGKWAKAKSLGENAIEVLQPINDLADLGRARVALAQAYFGLENFDW